MVAKRLTFFTVLLLSGCGLCDRYCDKQRDRCHSYGYCQPQQCSAPAPAPAYYGNTCQPSGVVPVPATSGYPQQAYNPYCP
jgi:hypothetical protein